MTWVQAFNQPYPGALQFLQAGGFLPYGAPRVRNSCYPGVGPAIGLLPGVYGQPAAGSRLPNPNWHRASNGAAFGAVGPAIGLSPMVYGVPFPGYPSLAQQKRVGVSAAEAQQWKRVYAAQLRDRGIAANRVRTRVHVRSPNPRNSVQDCARQTSPWWPSWSYGTGQYGGQYGPNREPNPGQCFDLDTGERMSCQGAPAGACINNRGCISVAVDCETGESLLDEFESCPRGWREIRRGNRLVGCVAPRVPNRRWRGRRWRRRNPGPSGEALPVPPYCGADACTSKDCGPCDWDDYAPGGRVRTVLEAVHQAEIDVERGMATANRETRRMYTPHGSPWADPSIAVLTKPGGPAPVNPVGTAQWQMCAFGQPVVADPSSNVQPIPGGMP